MTETVNGNRTLYTMLEMAKIAGTSKSTVYRTIKEKHIKPTKHKGQSNLYDEAVLKLIISKIEEDSVSHDLVQRIGIETLKKQLEVKDKQIEQLNEQLKMAQINLNQSQQLALEQSKKIKELETPKEDAKSVKEVPKKKSLFERIFGI
ncbi:MAG: helix-turn-helix domain-containing protein [Enterococcus sp.]|nr:helix-turn-helix domain-containing protein [Enterococcus sp.]